MPRPRPSPRPKPSEVLPVCGALVCITVTVVAVATPLELALERGSRETCALSRPLIGKRALVVSFASMSVRCHARFEDRSTSGTLKVSEVSLLVSPSAEVVCQSRRPGLEFMSAKLTGHDVCGVGISADARPDTKSVIRLSRSPIRCNLLLVLGVGNAHRGGER